MVGSCFGLSCDTVKNDKLPGPFDGPTYTPHCRIDSGFGDLGFVVLLPVVQWYYKVVE